jgi:2'-5' RNA ligase
VPYAVYLEVDAATSDRLERMSAAITHFDPTISTPRRFKHSHHLTIGVYQNIDQEIVIAALSSMLEKHSKINIYIPSVGCFPGEQSVLFAAPVPTEDLIESHKSYHRQAGDQSGSLSHYRPGSWFPHITIASGMTETQVVNAFPKLVENWRAIEGTLDTVKLVSLTPTEVIWAGDFR